MDLEPALLGLRPSRQHLIELPEDEVDGGAVHLQPRAAVDQPPQSSGASTCPGHPNARTSSGSMVPR
jgi:hypothetical protein